MTMMALTEADRRRAAALRQMRLVASALFVFAIVVYVLTLHQGGWVAYVNATAEAAMVGALADWFAVTALFRHPLGIPIPHSALVPRKKDVFAKSLEDFVAGHFLTGSAARERFVESRAAARAGAWLAHPGNSARVVEHAASLTRRALEHVTDDEIREVLDHSVLPRLSGEQISPIAGSLLEQVVEDDVHTHLVDLVVVEIYEWLLDNPQTFASVVGERAPTWTPLWVNSLVVDRLHTEAVKWIREVRESRQHRVRLAVDDLLRDLARNLQEDPATQRRAEQLKERFLIHPETSQAAMGLWAALKRSLLDALDDPNGRVRTRLQNELVSFGERLVSDDVLRARVERRVGEALEGIVDTHGTELVPVISQVIRRWDGKEAAERIELHVGRDLQFIRINGTVVGGLAGLLIHTLSQLHL